MPSASPPRGVLGRRPGEARSGERFGANLRVAAALYRQAIAEAEPESATRAEAEEGLAVALMRMLKDLPTAAQHAANATELAKRLGDGHALAEFRASHALIVGLRGDPRALGLMQRVEGVEAFDAESDFGPSRFLRTLWGTGFMSSVLRVFADDLDEARAGLELARARAVEAGDEASLPLLLRYLSLVELLAGDWSRAERLADEGYEASLQTGQPSQQAVLAASSALIAAHRGNVEATRATADEALRLGEETGSGFAELLARSALGLLELSLGIQTVPRRSSSRSSTRSRQPVSANLEWRDSCLTRSRPGSRSGSSGMPPRC